MSQEIKLVKYRHELKDAPVGLYRIETETKTGDFFDIRQYEMKPNQKQIKFANVISEIPLGFMNCGLEVERRRDGMFVLFGWEVDDREQKTSKVLVTVILDKSGSMKPIQKKTVDGFNEYLSGLREDKETEYSLTLVQFSSDALGIPHVQLEHHDKKISEIVGVMWLHNYEPSGGTPLFDAIGQTVCQIPNDSRPKIVVIITDGEENASMEFNRESVKNLIVEKEKLDWKFIFLGANIDTPVVAQGLGLRSFASYSVGNIGNAFRSAAASNIRYTRMATEQGVAAANAAPDFTEQERAEMLKK